MEPMASPSGTAVAARLETLARGEFRDLSPAEAKFVRATADGKPAEFGSAPPWLSDTDNAEAGPNRWGIDRDLRSDLILWLCVNQTAKSLMNRYGISLFGARIVGPLNLDVLQIPFPIVLSHCRLKESLFLYGCQIPSLSLKNSWTGQIVADSARIAQSLYLNDGFRADGVVSLLGASIGGDLYLNGGAFLNPGDTAINLKRATIKGEIFLRDTDRYAFRADGSVDFSGASTKALAVPNVRANWPKELRLDGFEYDRVESLPSDLTSRLEWLGRDKSRTLQPYHQLAKVLEDSGDAGGAMQLREEVQARLSSDDWLPFRLLERSIGYGYQSQNALWGLGGLTAIGALLYWRAHRMNAMTPTDGDAAKNVRSNRALPAHYPNFQPFIFSLENTFPLVKLGQTDKWQPDPQPEFVIRPPGNALRRFLALAPSSRFVRWFMWIQILLGWLLATLFLAAVSGIVHHG